LRQPVSPIFKGQTKVYTHYIAKLLPAFKADSVCLLRLRNML